LTFGQILIDVVALVGLLRFGGRGGRRCRRRRRRRRGGGSGRRIRRMMSHIKVIFFIDI
jgi:hypothetical protein